jgi:hypothetical protein
MLPDYAKLPEADTSRDTLPPYMTVTRVAQPCRHHDPAQLFHIPPPDAKLLRFTLILRDRRILVCRQCGAVAAYGRSRLRWGDLTCASHKADAITWNEMVAFARVVRPEIAAEVGSTAREDLATWVAAFAARHPLPPHLLLEGCHDHADGGGSR